MPAVADILTPGRELDALVAEKVMGYQWGRSETPPAGWMGPNGDLLSPWAWLRHPGSRGFMSLPPIHGDESRYIENVRHYSTDIAAAIEVVAKLRAEGWVYCTLQSYVAYPGDEEREYWNDATMSVLWWAEFSRYRSPVEVQSPGCKTPALAICLAALQAVAP